MAMKWNNQLVIKGTAWNVPTATATELNTLTLSAQAAYNEANTKDRTKVLTAKMNAAFNALAAAMRDLKKRYFYIPPLTQVDMAALDLTPPDTVPTPIGPPTNQVAADISYPGKSQHLLNIKPVAGHVYDTRADYGFKIHWGVMPPGGATTEQATSDSHYLTAPPQTPDSLATGDQFTKRKKELINHAYNQSGMTAYYCIRYENNKGDKGPWGPIFSAVIPE
jgi:hypothetical protein